MILLKFNSTTTWDETQFASIDFHDCVINFTITVFAVLKHFFTLYQLLSLFFF